MTLLGKIYNRESRAHLEAFEAKLLANNPNAVVFWEYKRSVFLILFLFLCVCFLRAVCFERERKERASVFSLCLWSIARRSDAPHFRKQSSWSPERWRGRGCKTKKHFCSFRERHDSSLCFFFFHLFSFSLSRTPAFVHGNRARSLSVSARLLARSPRRHERRRSSRRSASSSSGGAGGDDDCRCRRCQRWPFCSCCC